MVMPTNDDHQRVDIQALMRVLPVSGLEGWRSVDQIASLQRLEPQPKSE